MAQPLIRGNTKLGTGVWKSSLRAGISCPGKTDFCNTRCYAQKRTFNFPVVKAYAISMFEMARREPDKYFGLIFEQLSRGKIQTVRIHESGDFFNREYIEGWQRIVQSFPNVTFYTYTRSWRIPAMLAALQSLASLPNMYLNASTDPETGEPPSWFNLKTTIVNKGEKPQKDHIVCPEQTGKVESCGDCGLCFGKNKRPIAFLQH